MVGALNDTLALQPGTEEGENRWIIVETKPNDTDPTEPGTAMFMHSVILLMGLDDFTLIMIVFLCPELSLGHDTTSSMDAISPNASSKGFYFSCTQSAWECEDEELSTDSQDSDSELTVTDKTIHQVKNH